MYKLSTLIKIVKLAKQAYGKYKWQIVILAVFGFLGGLLEGLGINALIPMFSFVIDSAGAGTDIISQFIRNGFDFFHVEFRLRNILIFISLLFLFKGVVLILLNYIKIKITAEYERVTRNNLFQKTLKAKWSYLAKQKLGYLENVLSVDVKMSSAMLKQISASIINSTSLIVYVVLAFNISSKITLITLVVGALAFLVFKPFISQTKKVGTKETKLNKKVAHYINENVLGLKTIKASTVTKKVTSLGNDFFESLKKLKIRKLMMRDITGSAIQPMSMIFISVVFAISYKMPGFNLPSFIVIIYLINRIFGYVQTIQFSLHAMSEYIPHLQHVLNYEDKIKEAEEVDQGKEDFKFNNNLQFKDVYFEYDQGADVLKGINFEIKKGEMVGLIGTSGSGKTTVVDLILRLFEPTKNNINLDGVNIKDINLNNWRDNIGYVSQDIFLIDGTIADNIKFYDDSISDEQIAKAAKMANIYDFIQSLDNKFEHKIGDRGLFLSGGQRQRIVLARVFARQPQLLVLDEATSALDNESELAIQKVIENIKGEITVLVVAHRLSTVTNCDKLLVLDKGQIVEEGQPKKLLKDKQSYFYKTYNIKE